MLCHPVSGKILWKGAPSMPDISISLTGGVVHMLEPEEDGEAIGLFGYSAPFDKTVPFFMSGKYTSTDGVLYAQKSFKIFITSPAFGERTSSGKCTLSGSGIGTTAAAWIMSFVALDGTTANRVVNLEATKTGDSPMGSYSVILQDPHNPLGYFTAVPVIVVSAYTPP
jgi:hypothetical protein